MAGAAVSFRRVTKSYGPVNALEDFDLTIAPGEFMTFLGPSGSGKTTALNVLAGFADVTSGDVLISDRSVVNLPPERRNVGMVFQSYSLFPHLNVYENVAFPLKLRRVSRAEIRRKVEAVLGMVQMSDLAGRMPRELSGGQRQRVAFARAVVFEPPVLLMDEPLGALDLKLRQAMQLEIKHYHQQLGCTIVFVTHDQGEALALSDRIAVMGDGKIVQVDTASGIYDHPNSRYVAEFIGRTNILTLSGNGGKDGRIVELDVPFATRTPMLTPGAILSLRPEKIARAGPNPDDLVTFDATVTDVLFQGDLVHYTAQRPGGYELHFQEHRGPGAGVLGRGDHVTLGFHPDDALPIEKTRAEPARNLSN
jgi:putative spermidine/putrescine transport system ATP-binding protein